MSGPWEKYQAQSSGPWEKYAAQSSNRPAGLPSGVDLPGVAAHPPVKMEEPQKGFFRSFGDSSGANGALQAIAHPIDTVASIPGGLINEASRVGSQLKEAWNTPNNQPLKALDSTLYATPFIGSSLKEADQQAKDGNYKGAAGTSLGVLTSLFMPAAAEKAAGPVADSIKDFAIGDRDAAALQGLKVAPSSKKLQSIQRSVQMARPFLKGADSLKNLQDIIPVAKEEIWGPYREAIDKSGALPVMGPDGMSTLADLESERKQLSALNRGIKNRDPEAIQLAQQKGMNQADLLSREKAITAALDPALQNLGIDPRAIRKYFGAVSRVESMVNGKSTLLEKPQPYGLGKMADMRLNNPRTWFGKPLEGLRDLAAGRPLFGGSPMDIGIREGFAKAGPKPNLGTYTPPRIKGLLQAPMESIPLGEAPVPGEMPGGIYSAKPFPPQNVGEARIIRNRKGQIIPKSARKVEFPDESGKLPFGRDLKGRFLSRTPTRQAWMTGIEEEVPSAPPISGPGVLLRRKK